MKKTLVLGASPDPFRYAFRAVQKLKENGFEVIPIGIRNGKIGDTDIVIGKPDLFNIHTVTIYLNISNQRGYYEYILKLKPKRIIFNPGAENLEFAQLAKEEGIEVEFECTLVQLAIGKY